MTEKQLLARDAKREIGAELLQSVRDLKAGRWARKTTFEVLPEGGVRRRIERSDGTVEKEEVLTGPRWEIMAARAKTGLSQAEFAKALGVSKRTLENWEQGRAKPTGAARQLLRLAARFPDTVSRLLISNKFQPSEANSPDAGRWPPRRSTAGWAGHGGRIGD